MSSDLRPNEFIGSEIVPINIFERSILIILHTSTINLLLIQVLDASRFWLLYRINCLIRSVMVEGIQEISTEIMFCIILEIGRFIVKTHYGKTPRKVLANLLLAFLRATLPMTT